MRSVSERGEPRGGVEEGEVQKQRASQEQKGV